MSFLVIASFPESLLHFRGPLLAALQAKGIQVHVAAPNLPEGSAVRQQLQALGYVVHTRVRQQIPIFPIFAHPVSIKSSTYS